MTRKYKTKMPVSCEVLEERILLSTMDGMEEYMEEEYMEEEYMEEEYTEEGEVVEATQEAHDAYDTACMNVTISHQIEGELEYQKDTLMEKYQNALETYNEYKKQVGDPNQTIENQLDQFTEAIVDIQGEFVKGQADTISASAAFNLATSKLEEGDSDAVMTLCQSVKEKSSDADSHYAKVDAEYRVQDIYITNLIESMQESINETYEMGSEEYENGI